MRRRLADARYRCDDAALEAAYGATESETLPTQKCHCYFARHLRVAINADLAAQWTDRADESTTDEPYPFPDDLDVYHSIWRTPPRARRQPVRVQRRMASWVQVRMKANSITDAVSADDVKRLRSQEIVTARWPHGTHLHQVKEIPCICWPHVHTNVECVSPASSEYETVWDAWELACAHAAWARPKWRAS